MLTKLLKSLVILTSLATVAACSDANGGSKSAESAQASGKLPTFQVFKNPSCGCCSKWVDNAKENGFEITTHNESDMIALKAEKGIKPRYQSCHTAVAENGFVFEGHIPAKLIKKFLTEKPAGAIGLAAPGMPMGSPGMEMGDRFKPYDILLLKKDGSSEIYAKVNSAKEQY